MLKRKQVVEYASKHVADFNNCGTCKNMGKTMICQECHHASRYSFDWKEIAKDLVNSLAAIYNTSDLLALEYIQNHCMVDFKQKREVTELVDLNYKLCYDPGHIDNEDEYHKRMRKLISSYGIEFVNGDAQLKEGAYA
ncbi:MAG: hypothetical protein E7231_16655 [Cellulosilyticum sp.]|jgi:sugar phosphate isomerase/epimerase|nr:hypothetical protein [Cellulosilyticum sp.]